MLDSHKTAGPEETGADKETLPAAAGPEEARLYEELSGVLASYDSLDEGTLYPSSIQASLSSLRE